MVWAHECGVSLSSEPFAHRDSGEQCRLEAMDGRVFLTRWVPTIGWVFVRPIRHDDLAWMIPAIRAAR